MRILWSSNAFWAPTGYGIQAKYLLPRFQALGHEVAQFAWWGLQGAKIEMDGMPVYPVGFNAWGNDIIGEHARHFDADVVLSLMDIWVLPPDYRKRVGRPWVCWFPVDHYPCPDVIVERARGADYPVTYSRFGQEAMHQKGLDCHYIPHGVDCQTFKPLDKAECRRRLGIPADGYLAVMVAANKGMPSRKAFAENMWAFQQFCRERPDLDPYLYLHTDLTVAAGGADLVEIAKSFGITDRLRAVDLYQYRIGLPAEYLAAVYNAADVLLAASTSEGFGIPLIEAQACGCPVVTTDWTSMPELTVNGITTVPTQLAWTPMNSWVAVPSIVGITEAMLQIAGWDEAEREDRRQSGIAHMQANYDWDVCVERYWKPFWEMVEREIAEVANKHRWAPIGLWVKGEMKVPCLDKGCPAQLAVRKDGRRVVKPTGFETRIGDIELDLEDDPEGGVAKIVCREIRDGHYPLDKLDLQPGDVVLDVGAHVGIVSIYLAKRFPGVKAYAFEPVPANFERMLRNIEANGALGIVADNRAVAAPGVSEIVLHGVLAHNSGGMSVLADGPGIEVPATSIPDILKQHAIGRVKLLKTDCEGSEYDILTDGVLALVDNLVGEFHGERGPALLERCKAIVPGVVAVTLHGVDA